MRGRLVGANGLHKMKVGFEKRANHSLDCLGDCGGKHKGLAVFLALRRKVLLDLQDVLVEASFKQSISFIKTEDVEIRGGDVCRRVGQKVYQPSGRSDKEMAALHVDSPEGLRLAHSTHGRLDFDSSVINDFLCLDSNLLSQLSCWRDYDATNVELVVPTISISSGNRMVLKLWVLVEDGLKRWEQETQSLASSGPCLGNSARVSK